MACRSLEPVVVGEGHEVEQRLEIGADQRGAFGDHGLLVGGIAVVAQRHGHAPLPEVETGEEFDHGLMVVGGRCRIADHYAVAVDRGLHQLRPQNHVDRIIEEIFPGFVGELRVITDQPGIVVVGGVGDDAVHEFTDEPHVAARPEAAHEPLEWVGAVGVAPRSGGEEPEPARRHELIVDVGPPDYPENFRILRVELFDQIDLLPVEIMDIYAGEFAPVTAGGEFPARDHVGARVDMLERVGVGVDHEEVFTGERLLKHVDGAVDDLLVVYEMELREIRHCACGFWSAGTR